MLVVCDTTSINYLPLIEEIDLIRRLFGNASMPTSVYKELMHPRAPEVVRSWAAALPAWMSVYDPVMIFDPALLALDKGEQQAIALAELLHADLLLTDDSKARTAARRRGLPILTTLLILDAAAERGWVLFSEAVDRLLRTNFGIDNLSLVPLLRGTLSDNRRVMIFVLDNYDSFTYNLVQYMGELGAEMVIRRNDELTPEQVEALAPDRILISPGPCTPQDAGITIALIQHFAALGMAGRKVPILGVCLGHQALGAAFRANVVRASKLMHGKTSEVEHDGRTIFSGIPSTMTCTRYHSLIVEDKDLPEELEVSARTKDGTTIMALRHRSLPIEGVQFHPESILTTHGKQIIRNFMNLPV